MLFRSVIWRFSPPKPKEPTEKEKRQITAKEKGSQNLSKDTGPSKGQFNSTDQNDQPATKNRGGSGNPDPEWWMIWLTAGLVLVGGGQVWVLIRQTQVINQTFVLGNRAKLVVRDVTVDDEQRLINYRQIPGGPSSEPLSGRVLTVNVGGTEAFLVEEYSEIIFRRRGTPLRVGDNRFRGKSINRVRLPPGMNTRGIAFSTPAGEPILDPLFNRIMEGEVEVFLLGWVGYRDGLNNYRQTSYCRKWDLQSLRFIGTDDPDYESAD